MIDRRSVFSLRAGDLVAAISLYEPWASLMALGKKRKETRSWATSHRGPLLICAGGRLVKREMREYLAAEVFQHGLASLAPGRPVEIDDLNFGHAVALVNLVDCVPTADLLASGQVSDDEAHFGNFDPGRFGWVTTDLRTFETPFPVKGKQGIFYVRLPEL